MKSDLKATFIVTTGTCGGMQQLCYNAVTTQCLPPLPPPPPPLCAVNRLTAAALQVRGAVISPRCFKVINERQSSGAGLFSGLRAPRR